jgi:aryl-alcohol dehydrogenase-like predicted oxidoreductase
MKRKIPLGQSGLQVSPLAFGTDLIGSKYDRERSFALLDRFWENGGNFVDTANFYASWYPGCVGGESEKTIGAWMKERRNRDELVISSKLGFDYPESNGGLSRDEIQRECDKSLQRLGTDRIDLYYSHRDDPATGLEETMEAFNTLIKAGKVRAIGASNVPLWRIAEANAVSRCYSWAQYSAIEQRFTYLRPRHGADFGPQLCLSEDTMRFAGAHGVGLVAYSVLLQGAYVRDDKDIPPQYAGPDSEERLVMLREIAREVDSTPSQVIIAWIRQTRPGIIPIIAGSSIEQLDENIQAVSLRLTAEQMERLDRSGNPNVKRAWLQPT